MMGLVLAGMIGSIDVVPAFADDRRHGNVRYEQRGHGYDRDRYDRRYYRPYGYSERVYAPPPPPGIGIFFPPVYIRP
jgi:hypothetical protein